MKLLYFARLREAFGLSQETIQLPPEIQTPADLVDRLRLRGGPWAEELAPGRAYRIAVNQDLALADTRLDEQDEVAIFPPVTGG